MLHLYLGRPAMSLRTLYRRVREVAAWRRPRLVAIGAADAEQVVVDVRQAITDLPDGAVVLAEDQTHINLLPWVRSTWIVRGSRQRVVRPGTNRRRSQFGAVDLRLGRRFLSRSPGGRSAQRSSSPWSTCSPATPTAPVVVLVLDNVLIHRSKLVQAWLRAPAHAAAVRRPLQPHQPRRAHLGCAQGSPWPTARS